MTTLAWIPSAIRTPLAKVKRAYVTNKKRDALSKAAAINKLKIVVGAANTTFPGWHATNIEVLNMLKDEDWLRYFSPDTVEAILAEHVWEHLSQENGLLAAKNCYRFLKPGGRLRVAVPDGHHPNPAYIDDVKPGGSGSGADDHKVLYNYRTFSELFSSVGFTVVPLEYFDENGQFVANNWDQSDGMIFRSKRFDERNVGGKLIYTSIVLDAIKA